MSPARSQSRATTLPIVLGLALAFTVTEVDPLILNLNLPEVTRALHVPPQLVGLLGGAATLVMAAAVLAAGSLGDALGLKRLLTGGLVLVIIADLLAALSPGYGFLLAMRFLDGLGMTALLGVPLALLKESIAPDERPSAIGVFMGVGMFLCGVTPALTGWAVAALGWRTLFLVAPLMCAVSLRLTARHVPKAAPGRHRTKIDLIGVTLLGLALLTLVIGLADAQNGVSRPATWGPLAISATALVLFVLHERRSRDPAVDMALFRNPPFGVALAAAVTLNFLAAGLGVVLGQFGGVVLSLSPRDIGLLYLPGALMSATVVVLAGRLMAKRTTRPVMVTGLSLMLASGLLMAGTVSPTMALWLLVLATWLCNLGSLVTSTSVSETVLSQAPPERPGTVASVQFASGMAGYALGPTVYILLFNSFFRQQWQTSAASRGVSVTQAAQAVDALRSGMSVTPGSAGYDPNLLREAADMGLGQDFANGLRLTMLVVSVLPLLVAVAAWLLMPRHQRNRT